MYPSISIVPPLPDQPRHIVEEEHVDQWNMLPVLSHLPALPCSPCDQQEHASLVDQNIAGAQVGAQDHVFKDFQATESRNEQCDIPSTKRSINESQPSSNDASVPYMRNFKRSLVRVVRPIASPGRRSPYLKRLATGSIITQDPTITNKNSIANTAATHHGNILVQF